MAKSKANTTAGARPKASRREGRAPAAATAKAETGAAPAVRGHSAAPTKQAAVIGLLQREQRATLADTVPDFGAKVSRLALAAVLPETRRAHDVGRREAQLL